MKKFFSGGYLDAIFLLTVATMAFSVLFTFLTGESPLEALGVDPAIGTIGLGSLILVLLLVPVFLRHARKES